MELKIFCWNQVPPRMLAGAQEEIEREHVAYKLTCLGRKNNCVANLVHFKQTLIICLEAKSRCYPRKSDHIYQS